MRSPRVKQIPSVILAIPYLQSMVRGSGDHACAIIVVVNGKYEILMAMVHVLKGTIKSHLELRWRELCS